MVEGTVFGVLFPILAVVVALLEQRGGNPIMGIEASRPAIGKHLGEPSAVNVLCGQFNAGAGPGAGIKNDLLPSSSSKVFREHDPVESLPELDVENIPRPKGSSEVGHPASGTVLPGKRRNFKAERTSAGGLDLTIQGTADYAFAVGAQERQDLAFRVKAYASKHTRGLAPLLEICRIQDGGWPL